MNPLQIAWLNMREGRARTLVSVTGVAFTVFLMLMQLGFLGAVVRTATQLYDHLDFDLLLVSSEYTTLRNPGTLPRFRLAQARGAPGVQTVLPLGVTRGMWHGPHAGDHSLPPSRSVICTASSTAHSSCGLIENPDARVSTSCPSGVTAILPPTVGTRLTQTSISMTKRPSS